MDVDESKQSPFEISWACLQRGSGPCETVEKKHRTAAIKMAPLDHHEDVWLVRMMTPAPLPPPTPNL